MRTLNASQLKALEASQGHKSFAFYLDMRIGKTLAAIKFMERAGARKILVSCPPEAVGSWCSELAGDEQSYIDLSSGGAKAFAYSSASSATWHVANSQTILPRSKTGTHLHELHWDAVVVDESHGISNPRAKITKLFLKHLSKAEWKLCLSGLPAPERDIQYVAQLLFLHGSCMGKKSFWHWRAAYMHPAGFSWEFNSGARERLLDEVSKSSIVISRTDAGMVAEPVRRTIVVKQSTPLKTALTKLHCEWAVGSKDDERWLDNGLQLATEEQAMADGFHSSCFHNLKARAVADLVCGEFKRKRVVCWFNRNDAIDLVSAALVKRKMLDFIIVSGRHCTAEEKQKVLRGFSWGERGWRVLLVQIASASTGCNLAAADAAIIVSHTWSRSKRSQLEDRIIDQRKRDPPEIVDIVVAGTSDEDAVQSLRTKKRGCKSSLEWIAKRAIARSKHAKSSLDLVPEPSRLRPHRAIGTD